VKSNWPLAVEAVLKHEGGYINHPRDPGGATNMGITLQTLSRWRRQAVTKQDVKELSQREVEDIYKAWFWDEVNGDALPSGLDYAVFDFAVNSGPSRAVKTLQRLVKAVPDGEVGPNTLYRVKSNVPQIIAALSMARLEFMMRQPTWKDFGRGWKRRVLEVNREALSLAG
jgi:lysozyme family protein